MGGPGAVAAGVADVDDVPGPHPARRRLGAEEGAPEVEAEEVVELGGRGHGEGRSVEDGGAVDEHVEAPEPGHRRRDEAGPPAGGAEVGPGGDGGDAAPGANPGPAPGPPR